MTLKTPVDFQFLVIIMHCVVRNGNYLIDTWITQLRKGLMEFCLLNLLDQGESYGWEVVQSLKKIDTLTVSESTVYPILSRMKKDGYLDVRAVPSSGGPPRKYFSLSSSGKSRLQDMNNYWAQLNISISTIQSKST